jgi:thiol:disulfide interchange protein DsbD
MAVKRQILCFAGKVAFVGAFALAAASASACAQKSVGTPARWAVAPVALSLRDGSVANLRVSLLIQPGWHIYSVTQPPGGPIATRIAIAPEQPFQSAGPVKPTVPPKVGFDSAFNMKVELHDKAVGFIVPVRYTGTTGTRVDSVRVNVRYQVCNATLCYPPQTARLAAPLTRRPS